VSRVASASPVRIPRGSLVAAAFDLTAVNGIEPVPDGERNSWRTTATHSAIAAEGPFAAGWYKLSLKLRMTDRFTIRKKGELHAEFADDANPTVKLASFEWNRGLAEEMFFELPHDTKRLKLSVAHVDGVFVAERFELERVGPLRTLARALRMKLHLLAAYKNFWPVVYKGSKLAIRGRFREVHKKVLKSLTDAHTLRLETRQASEVDAALWRRQTIDAATTAKVRDAVETMIGPPPVSILLPVDGATLEQARMAIHSVLRQLYPHWQLVVAWPTNAVPEILKDAARNDSRIRFVLPENDRLGAAVTLARQALPCDYTLVLPPDWELREHALYHFVEELRKNPNLTAVSCEVPEPPRPHDDDAEEGPKQTRLQRWAASLKGQDWDEELERRRRLLRFGVIRTETLKTAEGLSAETTAEDVVRWAAGVLPPVEDESVPHILEMLATPLDGGSLFARGGLKPREPGGEPLFLCGNLVQISGYDHLVFALLKGMRSLGVHVHRHPMACFRNDLVPPALRPPSAPRGLHNPQLVITAPFIVNRYKPDALTAVYTMWETEWLDPEWVRNFNKTGLVLVPTNWVRDVFRKNGVTTPIEVVPLGYDPLTYHPTAEFPSECVFGTAGALDHGGLRKNVQRVIELFRKAFPDVPDVKLRVKITPTSPMVNTYHDPRIDVVQALLPNAELAGWYRSLTTYVNGSFGEGFGLHLMEAMACGRPLISAAYSGLTDYFDESVGYVVGHTVVETRNEIYRGQWGDPNDDDIVAQMRRVYADRAEARTLGERSASRARGFTWRDSGRRIVEVLEQHNFVQRQETGGTFKKFSDW
jgi:glycosyltransferase involved in cell wall biosynthesis